ncbi:putative metalloprotease [Streptoalloteichus tenebrarius]|uniref:Metalloprotease n=1 Tax=Streptoalloteichus tenebrarius (strain ATCC 17920 / DSM 40477 / JCM 4838 / CBS 697.72 / NBRC 16177 / NCIMB 11028 / NRRL B-12390 / A12253. 1 / ISP 5477) TaxID=1933 RepID=A0ABT1HWJ8_STRSD|nr:neutral zinc metallopeptidase [Streptoalloteichus tenebrarius]MCP2259884.1 putative metalloprotease [Streptoalloteichus tenebrarius]BFF03207.1 neutral zinc metallopeptidase [Streptoalloteichus tenebrarius]
MGTAAVVSLLATLLGACSVPVPGVPSAAESVTRSGVDPSFVRGTDGGLTDRLAAATVTDVQDYWRQTFEPTFGRAWQDLKGGFYSVDSSSRSAKPAPCTEKASDVEGNAFYCPSADAIAWDRSALLPVLREKYGDAAVVIVLAHEIGHAVHHRAGVGVAEQRQQPSRYPTILTEAMADCYAGAFVRWVADGRAPHLRINGGQLDSALGALVSFRDPVGTAKTDRSAHGNAFDRVSAFQDGFQQGPKLCSGMSVDNRKFTQTTFTSFDDRASGGNMEFDRMIGSVTADLDNYFNALVTQRGGSWRRPTVRVDVPHPECEGRDQGPVAFCPATGRIELDGADEVSRLHTRIGDYATGTLVATRYGLAAQSALGRPVRGEAATKTALCLAGAYTGTVFGRREGFGLSPGDLDEAVQVLLGYDYGARDVAGEAVHSGFDRVEAFRNGALGGPAACGFG